MSALGTSMIDGSVVTACGMSAFGGPVVSIRELLR